MIRAGSEASGSLQAPSTRPQVDTIKYYCPFLDRGFCRKPSRCNFSHETHESVKIPNDYCHFYLANQCLYGQDCKFLHTEPDAPATPATCNTSARSSSTSSTCKPTTRTWQGGRLIASIRNNNLLEEHPEPTKASSGINSNESAEMATRDLPLCPYAVTSGDCPFPHGQCSYLHGEACDLCGSLCLHPFNENQRLQHRDECLREIEHEMELSFAVQRSKDKVCGICMDTVMEKKPITSSRFGILEKCNHIFCLDCIRKWRGTKQFDSRTIRACPECRVSSDFVVPSKYWVEDQDDKDKLIQDYKSALRAKPCRYFNEGKGECPFAGSCFYRHAYPDGRLAEMEAPKPRRRLYGARGIASDVANYIFWNFITAADDDQSEDGVDSFYDWEMASIDEEDEDEYLDYGYDV